MVIPVTGVPPATVVRLLMVTLRSAALWDAIVNVLKSRPSGWSVPVKFSVCCTGVGATGVELPHADAIVRTIAPCALTQGRLVGRHRMELSVSARRWHAGR